MGLAVFSNRGCSGSLLVSQIKDKFGNEVEIIPIPGASALVTALSASGIISHEFTFLGFLPHKKGRETLFKEIANSIRASVFYESPHRIIKTLEALEKFAPDKKVIIARELTKIYEQFVSGKPNELISYFENNKDKIRGEFVVIVE
jgi:16S rRNA (cytidine1402-2'-O)-methyltransferase